MILAASTYLRIAYTNTQTLTRVKFSLSLALNAHSSLSHVIEINCKLRKKKKNNFPKFQKSFQ